MPAALMISKVSSADSRWRSSTEPAGTPNALATSSLSPGQVTAAMRNSAPIADRNCRRLRRLSKSACASSATTTSGPKSRSASARRCLSVSTMNSQPWSTNCRSRCVLPEAGCPEITMSPELSANHCLSASRPISGRLSIGLDDRGTADSADGAPLRPRSSLVQ